MLTLAACTQAAMAAEDSRLNVLVIHTDEHSFRTLGCYRALLPEDQAFVWGKGVAVETPSLDWIARNGAIAERFYATSPVCTPSRASFLTGRYPQNTGAIQNNLALRDTMVTFGEALRRKGYATGYAGKWHLDGPGKPQFGPERKFGWEDNRYMFNRGHYKNLIEDERGPRVGAANARGEPSYDLVGADQKSFTTDFLTDRALEFIERNKERPFCYMISFPDPHGPNSVRAPYDTMFRHLKFEQPASARSPGEHLPAYAATQNAPFSQVQMALYFGMVKCIDDNVGRLLASLRREDLLNRTLIVFTADHGDLCGEHGRHNKGVPMDGSARIPLLIYAPGTIKAGTVVRPTLGTVDFKPTVLSLLGIPQADADEGRDASGLFTGKAADSGWHDMTFVRIGGAAEQAAVDEEEGSVGPGWMGAFSRRFKFVVAPAAAPALFDLESDPHELKNLFASPEHRETVRRMARELSDYARRYNDPHLASKSIQATLDWAINGRGEYSVPPAKESSPGKGKGRKKKQAV